MKKQTYIEQVKIIGQYLIDTADEIIQENDFGHVREVHITTHISPDGIPTVDITKEYIPKKILGGD